MCTVKHHRELVYTDTLQILAQREKDSTSIQNIMTTMTTLYILGVTTIASSRIVFPTTIEDQNEKITSVDRSNIVDDQNEEITSTDRSNIMNNAAEWAVAIPD